MIPCVAAFGALGAGSESIVRAADGPPLVLVNIEIPRDSFLKLICAAVPPSVADLARVPAFFRWYGRCKSLLNLVRGQWGRTRCLGLDTAEAAIDWARPLNVDDRQGSRVRF